VIHELTPDSLRLLEMFYYATTKKFHNAPVFSNATTLYYKTTTLDYKILRAKNLFLISMTMAWVARFTEREEYWGKRLTGR